MKIFIQARTSSKRLPGKVFKNLINKNHSLDLLIFKLSKLFSKKNIKKKKNSYINLKK